MHLFIGPRPAIHGSAIRSNRGRLAKCGMELALSVSGTPKSPQVAPEIDRILVKRCFAVFEALHVLRFRQAGCVFFGLLPEGLMEAWSVQRGAPKE